MAICDQATVPSDKVKIDNIIAAGIGAENMNKQVRNVVLESFKTVVLAERKGKLAHGRIYRLQLW